jgi:hypothetical protein
MDPLLASQMFSVWLSLVTIQSTSDLNMFSLPLGFNRQCHQFSPALDGYRRSWHHYCLMFPVSGGAIPKSG